jgi:hypothetical protein
MAQPDTRREIARKLQTLPDEQLAAVLDFVSRLAERGANDRPFATMLASERVLAREWLSKEEDEAWGDL